MTTLAELEERREYECRLTPDRALETLDEAEEFLRDRGLLTRTADSALPSLFEACHEEPYARESPRLRAVAGDEVPVVRPARRARLPHPRDPPRQEPPRDRRGGGSPRPDLPCRARAAEEADESWARLLRHLADAGPSELDDLQTELALAPKELKSLRSPLERCGAVVARSIVYEDPHRHTSVLARWDQAHPEPSGGNDPRQALGDLLCAGVRAAVVAPERELARWFSWRWYWDDSLVDVLVGSGRLARVDEHVTTG